LPLRAAEILLRIANERGEQDVVRSLAVLGELGVDRDIRGSLLEGRAMDFKQFYFSAQGRVNRKQFWLWLVLPVFVISVILAFIDMATGNYIGPLLQGIVTLAILIPWILVYIMRFHDRDKSGQKPCRASGVIATGTFFVVGYSVAQSSPDDFI
jgi:uncharacterized membrane protein YhaH (DUF805 family)